MPVVNHTNKERTMPPSSPGNLKHARVGRERLLAAGCVAWRDRRGTPGVVLSGGARRVPDQGVG